MADLSSFRPKRNSLGQRGIDKLGEMQREQAERDAALEESGRDPFAERLQAAIPINKATKVGREEGPLAGVASWLSQGSIMRGGVGDPYVTAKSLLSRFRPKLPGGERAPTIRAFHEGGIQEPPPTAYADELLKMQSQGDDILIPGTPNFEGAAGTSGITPNMLSSPHGEFAPGAWEEILKNAQAGGLDEKRQMLHNLYNQFLNSAIYGSTNN